MDGEVIVCDACRGESMPEEWPESGDGDVGRRGDGTGIGLDFGRGGVEGVEDEGRDILLRYVPANRLYQCFTKHQARVRTRRRDASQLMTRDQSSVTCHPSLWSPS